MVYKLIAAFPRDVAAISTATWMTNTMSKKGGLPLEIDNVGKEYVWQIREPDIA